MARKIIALINILLFLPIVSGCSPRAKNTSATYVSPLQYQSYNCNQVGQELLRVNQRVLEVTGKQDSAATKDAVALGVGLVIFWPALIFMLVGDKKEELGRLKGEYEALEKTAIGKDCDIAHELQEAKLQKVAYEESKRPKDENAFVEDEFKRLNEKLVYYTSQRCIDDLTESQISKSTTAQFECEDIANLYQEKINLLKDNPDGYFYKKAIEKKDQAIMKKYQKETNGL